MSKLLASIIALVCTLLGLLGGLWLGGHPESLPGTVRDAFVEEERALRAEVIGAIEDNYYKSIDEGEFQDASVRGIVESLGDRFSHYFSPEETAEFQQSISGEFSGVGMSVEETRRGLLVINVFDDSPAERAGVEMGDVVTEVDGESIAGESSETSTAKIKGEPGSEVELTLLNPRTGNERQETIERAAIEVPVAEGELRTQGGEQLGIVRLLSFTEGAHGALREQLARLIERGADGLVLDLRGNGGGLLQEAVLVSSQFVEDGEIVTTDGRAKTKRVFEAQGDAISDEIEMVVLVDGGSASASEIVTGALRDHERATVVGERTFGKGVFQEVQPLSNGGALDLTVGRYFLPDGQNISDDGIEPAVDAVDDPDTERDEALPKALDALADKVD